jgi:hypothetical protein
MSEHKPGPEPKGTDPTDRGPAEAAGGQQPEDKQKIKPQLSVEEHLAGLWKMLGLGD